MPISDKLIDQLLEGCDSPEDILGEAGLLKQLTKKVAERATASSLPVPKTLQDVVRKAYNQGLRDDDVWRYV